MSNALSVIDTVTIGYVVKDRWIFHHTAQENFNQAVSPLSRFSFPSVSETFCWLNIPADGFIDAQFAL